MAVYALAADPDDFDALVVAGTTAANFLVDTNDVRVGFTLNSQTDDAQYLDKNFSTAVSTFWTHFCYGTQYNNFFSTRMGSNNVFIKFYSSGVKRFGFRFTSTTSNVLEALQWNGSSWSSLGSADYGSTISVPGTNDPWQVDIFIDIPNGRISFYRNQAPILTLTGLSISGAAVTSIRLSTPGDAYNDAIAYSELLVADWNTMKARVVSKAPTANGNYTEWTGAGYTALDELQASADYMTSATANQRQGVLCNTWPALGTNESIEYVQINTISVRDVAGPANQNVYWRISATDYNDTDTAVNTTSTKTFRGFSASPAGGAWTPTILNSAEVGVRSRT